MFTLCMKKDKKRLHLSALIQREAWYTTRLPKFLVYDNKTGDGPEDAALQHAVQARHLA